MILQPACMLIINYSCVFSIKFIKPTYSSVYNYAQIILFLATALADTRGHDHEVTWQDNHMDAYSYSYKFAYYVKHINCIYSFIVVLS